MVSMATHYAILENWCVPTNTHISVATHPKLLNFVTNKFLHRAFVPDDQICKLSNFNI